MGWFSRLFGPSPRADKKPKIFSIAQTADVVEAMRKSAPASPAPELPPSSATASGNKSIPWMRRDRVNADFLSWLFEGSEELGLFASRVEQDILVQVEKAVNSNNAGSDMVRRMPGVIPQLLQSLRTQDFSGTELARQISHDVVLVAEIIRIANSSLYKTTEEITSIERAVMVLGHTGLRQLITSVAFKPIIDLKSGYFTRNIAPKIWNHSEKCARANRLLAEGETVQAFEAFLAGLIQGVGLIVSLRFIDQLAGDQSIGSAGFCNSLIVLGRKLSVGIAREWRFPDTVVHAIEEQGNYSKNANLSPIGAILEIGDFISKIQILAEHQRLNADDPDLIDDLSEKTLHCMKELKNG